VSSIGINLVLPKALSFLQILGSGRLGSGEGLTILGHEFLDSHWLAATDFGEKLKRTSRY
jgi:hypothetical protein